MDLLGTEMWPCNVPDYQRSLDVARKRLRPVEFVRAWAERREWSLEWAQVECAASQPVAAPDVFAGLTPRERQVAVLVAQGLTNRSEAREFKTVQVKLGAQVYERGRQATGSPSEISQAVKGLPSVSARRRASLVQTCPTRKSTRTSSAKY